MTETREPYQTFADEPCAPLFMVELIDSKGKSHGYIGYRFHAPGAQAACDGWNNQRERFDLVAVIKPVIEPAVVEVPVSALPESTDQRQRTLQCVKPGRRSRFEVPHIVTETPAISQLRSHKELLIKSLKACMRAMDDGRPEDPSDKRWDRARELADEVMAKVTD